ncbi:MAG: hypothetical protein GTO49_36210, partial [Anaerolineae bacterium]|nr:hypothetical protein [Anaerolineae bacterium]
VLDFVYGIEVEADAHLAAYVRGKIQGVIDPGPHRVIEQLGQILEGTAIHRNLHPALIPGGPAALRLVP